MQKGGPTGPARLGDSVTRKKAASERWETAVTMGLACGVPGRAAKASREARLRTHQSLYILHPRGEFTTSPFRSAPPSLSISLLACKCRRAGHLTFEGFVAHCWACGGFSRTRHQCSGRPARAVPISPPIPAQLMSLESEAAHVLRKYAWGKAEVFEHEDFVHCARRLTPLSDM